MSEESNGILHAYQENTPRPKLPALEWPRGFLSGVCMFPVPGLTPSWYSELKYYNWKNLHAHQKRSSHAVPAQLESRVVLQGRVCMFPSTASRLSLFQLSRSFVCTVAILEVLLEVSCFVFRDMTIWLGFPVLAFMESTLTKCGLMNTKLCVTSKQGGSVRDQRPVQRYSSPRTQTSTSPKTESHSNDEEHWLWQNAFKFSLHFLFSMTNLNLLCQTWHPDSWALQLSFNATLFVQPPLRQHGDYNRCFHFWLIRATKSYMLLWKVGEIWSQVKLRDMKVHVGELDLEYTPDCHARYHLVLSIVVFNSVSCT